MKDWATFRALELSDRIRLKLPSYTDDAHIENLALSIPLSGKVPVCTVQATFASSMATPPPPPPPPPAGDSVTVPLTGATTSTNLIRWPDNQSLGSVFSADGSEQTMTFVTLYNAGPHLGRSSYL